MPYFLERTHKIWTQRTSPAARCRPLRWPASFSFPLSVVQAGHGSALSCLKKCSIHIRHSKLYIFACGKDPGPLRDTTFLVRMLNLTDFTLLVHRGSPPLSRYTSVLRAAHGRVNTLHSTFVPYYVHELGSWTLGFRLFCVDRFQEGIPPFQH